MATRIDTSPTALAAARRREPQVTKQKGSGLTPRIKDAVRAYVHGWDGAPTDRAITHADAANFAGLRSARTLRDALRRPAVEAFFREEMRALRLGERPANLRRLKAIRDDADLSKSAAGARTQVAAIVALETDPDASNGVEVNVSTSVSLAVETAGYVIRLPAREAPRVPEREPITIEHEASDDDA